MLSGAAFSRSGPPNGFRIPRIPRAAAFHRLWAMPRKRRIRNYLLQTPKHRITLTALTALTALTPAMTLAAPVRVQNPPAWFRVISFTICSICCTGRQRSTVWRSRRFRRAAGRFSRWWWRPGRRGSGNWYSCANPSRGDFIQGTDRDGGRLRRCGLLPPEFVDTPGDRVCLDYDPVAGLKKRCADRHRARGGVSGRQMQRRV